LAGAGIGGASGDDAGRDRGAGAGVPRPRSSEARVGALMAAPRRIG
jgi:hypothetical protein